MRTPRQKATWFVISRAALLGLGYYHAAAGFTAPPTTMSKYRADPFHGHTEVWLLLAKYRMCNESTGK